MTNVELLEYHQYLYKKTKISVEIKDNWLHSKIRAAGGSLIFAQKDRISAEIEVIWLHCKMKAVRRSSIPVQKLLNWCLNWR